MSMHGATLVSNGFNIIPIIPNKKVPGRHTNGEWQAMPEWSKHCDRTTKPFELDIWQRWPGCAIGLACGNVVGIDIDVMDSTVAHDLERFARDTLGETTARRVGKAPKRTLYYRAATPFQGRKLHPLEVLARGNQSVIYGIHPDTGNPYEWTDETLLELDISSLPEITEQQALTWLEEAYRRLPDEFKPATLSSLSSGEVSAWHGPSDPVGTLEAITSALSFVPNDELDGTSWIKVCHAIKAALGAQGRDLWLDWSKSSSKSGASGKSDTAEKRFDSARPTSVGAGTIYYLAEQRGWVPGSELVLNGNDALLAGGVHPAAGLIAKAAALERARKVGASPVSGLAPIIMEGMDGLLRDFHEHIVSTSRSPQPWLALGAALCAIGAAAGRRYRSVTNIRTNMMVLALADSGAGKDRPLKCLTNSFIESGLPEYVGGSKIASSAGLVTAVRDHPVQLFALDEVGHMFGINGSRNAGAHKSEIMPLITEIWSKAGDFYLGTNYANTKDNPRSVIHQPHVVLYGASVPGVFWKAFGNSAVADGSLARFLLFKSPENYPDLNDEIPDISTPDHIKVGLRLIAGCSPKGSGNLAEFHLPMQSNESHTPTVVRVTDDAQTALVMRTQEELSLKRQNEGTPKTAFLARLYEHTVRVAMIKAIGRDHNTPVITLQDVQWAVALVDHCVGGMMNETDDLVADNETEAAHKFVLSIISKAGSIGHNMLTRKIQKIPSRTRQEIIQTLIDSGQIILGESKSEGAGRPTKVYTAMRGAN